MAPERMFISPERTSVPRLNVFDVSKGCILLSIYSTAAADVPQWTLIGCLCSADNTSRILVVT